MIPFQPDRSWFECYWWHECPERVAARPLRTPLRAVTRRILRVFRRRRAGHVVDAKPLPPRNGAGR